MTLIDNALPMAFLNVTTRTYLYPLPKPNL